MLYFWTILFTFILALYYLYIGIFFSFPLPLQVFIEETIKILPFLLIPYVCPSLQKRQKEIYSLSVLTFIILENILYSLSYYFVVSTDISIFSFIFARLSATSLHLFLLFLVLYLLEKKKEIKLYQIFLIVVLLHSFYNLYVW